MQKKFNEIVQESMEQDELFTFDEAELEEVRKNSKDFHEKMRLEISNYYDKEEKVKPLRTLSKVAAFAASFLVIFCAWNYLNLNQSLESSELIMNVTGWFEDSFLLQEGSDTEYATIEDFSEENITYVPEGFELVDEVINPFFKIYTYSFDNREFSLKIISNSFKTGVDNTALIHEDFDTNLHGIEYNKYYYQTETESLYYIAWEYSNITYQLFGTTDFEILESVMEGIIYN